MLESECQHPNIFRFILILFLLLCICLQFQNSFNISLAAFRCGKKKTMKRIKYESNLYCDTKSTTHNRFDGKQNQNYMPHIVHRKSHIILSFGWCNSNPRLCYHPICTELIFISFDIRFHLVYRDHFLLCWQTNRKTLNQQSNTKRQFGERNQKKKKGKNDKQKSINFTYDSNNPHPKIYIIHIH